MRRLPWREAVGGAALGATLLALALLLPLIPYPYDLGSSSGPLPTRWTHPDPAGADSLTAGAGAIFELHRTFPASPYLHPTSFNRTSYTLTALAPTDGAPLWVDSTIAVTNQSTRSLVGPALFEEDGVVGWLVVGGEVAADGSQPGAPGGTGLHLMRWNATTGVYLGAATAFALSAAPSVTLASAPVAGYVGLSELSVTGGLSNVTLAAMPLAGTVNGPAWVAGFGPLRGASDSAAPSVLLGDGQELVATVDLPWPHMYAFTLANGAPLWNTTPSDAVVPGNPGALPRLTGGSVWYFCLGGPLGASSGICRLNGSTGGTVAWASLGPSLTDFQLLPGTVGGVALLFDGRNGSYLAYDSSGRLLWVLPVAPGGGGATFLSAEMVGFGNGRGFVSAQYIPAGNSSGGSSPTGLVEAMGLIDLIGGSWLWRVSLDETLVLGVGLVPAPYYGVGAVGETLLYVCGGEFGAAGFAPPASR